jgi:hypothetical protein
MPRKEFTKHLIDLLKADGYEVSGPLEGIHEDPDYYISARSPSGEEFVLIVAGDSSKRK